MPPACNWRWWLQASRQGPRVSSGCCVVIGEQPAPSLQNRNAVSQLSVVWCGSQITWCHCRSALSLLLAAVGAGERGCRKAGKEREVFKVVRARCRVVLEGLQAHLQASLGPVAAARVAPSWLLLGGSVGVPEGARREQEGRGNFFQRVRRPGGGQQHVNECWPWPGLHVELIFRAIA